MSDVPSRRSPRLAVLGGDPAFSEALHVGRPNVGDRRRFLARMDDLLERRWLTNNGPYVCELEARIAELLGVRHCVAVCNGTMALQIMIAASGMTGEVIVPSFTFVATAHALTWQGLTPVFCDVDPVTHTLDPAKVESLITDATSAIIGVHVWGRACDSAGLQAVADQHGLRLCFDAAHAFACSCGGRMIGSLGLAEAFSFHATKFFSTFEGGAVATDDDMVANRCRAMRDFGFAGPDRVVALGINGKMSEPAAAMGLTNLESLDTFIACNHRNHVRYREGLAGVAGVRLAAYPDAEHSNFQYVVLEVDADASPLDRDELLVALHAENVLARRYFFPGCHLMVPYKEWPLRAPLSVTDVLTRTILTLPTGTSVDDDDVAEVCRLIRAALASAPEVKTAVAPSVAAYNAVIA